MNKKETRIRQDFKKAVIEAIHGLPYEEAALNEAIVSGLDGITEFSLGRVLGALEKKGIDRGRFEFFKDFARFAGDTLWSFDYEVKFDWQLLKEDKIECTDDDQTLETIEALLKIFK